MCVGKIHFSLANVRSKSVRCGNRDPLKRKSPAPAGFPFEYKKAHPKVRPLMP